ncbi:hypothetical protein SAMN05428997_116157 [Bosea sp. CRIB-10]|uniref:hypothetical protein n=1 Tax=Bosea sp. CRIB-10 TaxID=378404 RepID=UPI0008E1973B|nr:hypothetical protein [Bosea sp. CRIB-10]SFD05734.1 hypothetical protein SAMN05428997_116157 [Bosea sp. CRIB-10]
MGDVAQEGGVRPEVIPVSLFSRKSNKTTALINNSKQDFSFEAKQRWFEFDFSENVYVQSIQIFASGYEDWNAVSLELIHVSGKILELKSNFSDGKFSLGVGRFATGFRFRPDVRFTIFTNQLISSVIVTGYTPAEFSRLEEETGRIGRSNADLQARLAAIEEREKAASEKVIAAEAHVNELKAESAQLDKDIGQANAQFDTLKAEISQNQKRKEEVISASEDLKSKLENLRAERRIEESELNDKKNERARLIEEIRLFPSEISGFVQETKRSILSYILLSALPMAIILYVTYNLYKNSTDLTQIYKSGEVDVWTIFLTRMPFVIVSFTILQVCGVFVKRFINEIIDANNQRLNLSAISIIAKDVSTASASSLDLSPDEKFELETKLKMSLLREQMQKYISDKYEYRAAPRLSWSRRQKPAESKDEHPSADE